MCRHHIPAAESCALDVADGGASELRVVAELLGISRERVRQIEEKALGRVRSRGHRSELRDYADHEPTGPAQSALAASMDAQSGGGGGHVEATPDDEDAARLRARVWRRYDAAVCARFGLAVAGDDEAGETVDEDPEDAQRRRAAENGVASRRLQLSWTAADDEEIDVWSERVLRDLRRGVSLRAALDASYTPTEQECVATPALAQLLAKNPDYPEHEETPVACSVGAPAPRREVALIDVPALSSSRPEMIDLDVRVLRWVREALARGETTPSSAEIARGVGLKGRTAGRVQVTDAIRRLRAAGCIEAENAYEFGRAGRVRRIVAVSDVDPIATHRGHAVAQGEAAGLDARVLAFLQERRRALRATTIGELVGCSREQARVACVHLIATGTVEQLPDARFRARVAGQDVGDERPAVTDVEDETMPREVTGEVRAGEDGFEARITIEGKDRVALRFPPDVGEALAKERAAKLAKLARRLRRTGHAARAPALLLKAAGAPARPVSAFEQAIGQIVDVCERRAVTSSDLASPLEERREVVVAEIEKLTAEASALDTAIEALRRIG